MEEHLQALLAGLGYPVAWGGLGRGTALPRIALYKVSGSDDMVLAGRAGAIRGRVQADCFGSSYAETVSVARAVRALLSGYRGGPIRSAALMALRDLTEVEGGERIHRASLDFMVDWDA